MSLPGFVVKSTRREQVSMTRSHLNPRESEFPHVLAQYATAFGSSGIEVNDLMCSVDDGIVGPQDVETEQTVDHDVSVRREAAELAGKSVACGKVVDGDGAAAK